MEPRALLNGSQFNLVALITFDVTGSTIEDGKWEFMEITQI